MGGSGRLRSGSLMHVICHSTPCQMVQDVRPVKVNQFGMPGPGVTQMELEIRALQIAALVLPNLAKSAAQQRACLAITLAITISSNKLGATEARFGDWD